MFKRNNLFPLFVLFVLSCVAVRAQETTVTTTTSPKGNVQIFTNDGGSYLGVQLQEINKENFSKFSLREVRGVAVEKVTENSPAAQAGLKDGDVIVRFEGEEVTSVRKLQRLIGEVAPDHQAKVTVMRQGREQDFTVTVGKRSGAFFKEGTFNMSVPAIRLGEMPVIPNMPEFSIRTMPSMPKAPNAPNMGVLKGFPNGDNMVWSYAFGRRIGISTSSLSKQLGDYFGVADGKGILITNVNENSPAAKGGLKAGDVIVEADGKTVDNTTELMKAINAKEKGSVTLTVIRNKNRQTITVEPEGGKQ